MRQMVQKLPAPTPSWGPQKSKTLSDPVPNKERTPVRPSPKQNQACPPPSISQSRRSPKGGRGRGTADPHLGEFRFLKVNEASCSAPSLEAWSWASCLPAGAHSSINCHSEQQSHCQGQHGRWREAPRTGRLTDRCQFSARCLTRPPAVKPKRDVLATKLSNCLAPELEGRTPPKGVSSTSTW